MARSAPDLREAALRSFRGQAHDHARCVRHAIGDAEAICARRGAQLTELRRRVLELIWSSHAPVGAYDLLRRLSRERQTAAPPTVYRALDFLLEHGLIHRIESLNAFVGCAAPVEAHSGQFLICRRCGTAAELDDPRVRRAIARGARELRFTVESDTVEIRGLCAACGGLGGAPHGG